jgi:putative oxidoreductase
MTYDNRAEPRLVLPFLRPLYERLVPLSWLVIRATAGLLLFVHGYPKLGHVDAVAANMAKNGLEPALLVAYLVTFVETIGALSVALGLFTRFFAAAAAIDLAVITFHVFWPRGFASYEYLLMWGLFLFAIALRGGGPYSLDRLLGREL